MEFSTKRKYRYAYHLSFFNRRHSTDQDRILNRFLLSDDSAGTLAERLGARVHIPAIAVKRFLGPGKWLLLAFLVAGVIVHEMRTSEIQSRVFHYFANKMTYTMGAGPSPRIVFPKEGPFDTQRGYTRLPQYSARLESEGYRIPEQARFSPTMAAAARLGISPPVRESDATGLIIRSQSGIPLFDAIPTERMFKSYAEIPRLLVSSLTFIEDRDLGQPPVDDTANPVLNWNRLAKASVLFAARKAGLPVHLEGGSTLATQMEKYRHSAYGETSSAIDKLRQMISASLKVYRKGTDTRTARREILLDYLNTMPLAAAPDFGEIEGLGEGLYAWFGASLPQTCADLSQDAAPERKARAYKRVLVLLCASRAPNYYLIQDRRALEARVDFYLDRIREEGIVDGSFAELVHKTSPAFLPSAPIPDRGFDPQEKTTYSIRTHLLQLLGMNSLYDLDRLDLQADTTINARLQEKTSELIEHLKDGKFLASHGLLGEHLLSRGDPRKVNYAVLLYQLGARGNLLRIHLDNLDEPLDINSGVKLQLGSTAKLRVLANYLDIMTSLYNRMSKLPAKTLQQRTAEAKDPITRWAATTLSQGGVADLHDFLEKSMNRTYLASPAEAFFTGGGIHHFVNFEPDENDSIYTVRDAFAHSVNLAFIRLLRDVVGYYEARLPYDVNAVLNDPGNPVRAKLLQRVADRETRQVLMGAFKDYSGLSPGERIAKLLGKRVSDPRALTILWFAWHPNQRQLPEAPLAQWLRSRQVDISSGQVRQLVKAYGNLNLTLADYGYLLNVHPLVIWCAGVLQQDPGISYDEVLARSKEARKISSEWLFKDRNRHAQNLRLRIQIERDAFAQMTPEWHKLGFPFDSLVPSLATAIGCSSDRPAALADLMGIILNDGVRRPSVRLNDLQFGVGTPYETVFQPAAAASQRVMPKAVALVLREALAKVVETGTAIRAKGAFALPGGKPVIVGGKTGSGDNRFDVFGPHGSLIDSRPVNRTATLVFYIGDRYYGVITAYVMGRQAANYDFTSSLPAAILKLMAPSIDPLLARGTEAD